MLVKKNQQFFTKLFLFFAKNREKQGSLTACYWFLPGYKNKIRRNFRRSFL